MKDHSNDPNWVLTKKGAWVHKNTLANMQKAGQPTKNPKGRPKLGLTISEATRTIIESRDPKTGKKVADSVARKIVEQALAGNPQFMQMLLDRVEGKVTQPLGGGNGKDLIFHVIVNNDEVRDMVNDVLAGKRTDAGSSGT